MLWRLWRSITAELLKVISLTTAVLVSVIAFGATIKPLAAGGLAPADILRYVCLAIVPMLQFALPFAAGFASTMVMHRMTSDNEVLAVSSSGVSYARFLTPVFALAIVLSVLLLGLTHYVIPHFWVKIQHVVAKDASRLLQMAVKNGEAFAFGDLQIFAERAELVQPLPGSGATTRLLLKGLAAAEMDQDGVITNDVTAEVATADFYLINERPYLKLALLETVHFNATHNRLAYAPRLNTRLIPLPSALADNPKFMSLSQLLAVRDDPNLFGDVIRTKLELALALQQLELWDALAATLQAEGRITAFGESRDEHIILHAERLRDRTITRESAQPVMVEIVREGMVVRRYTCEYATLNIIENGTFGVLFDIVLNNCNIFIDPQSSESYQRTQLLLPSVTIDGLAAPDMFDLSADELLQRAQPQVAVHQHMRERVDDLEERLHNLDGEVAARIEERNATAATGGLLLLLGSILAMWLRNSLPLTIYVIAFLPAIADLLLISGASQFMRDQSIEGGRLIMWSGNMAMAGITLFAYLRLARH
ncbi:MAG: LptF/LptG family permease [Phycisphaerales bacterium]